MRASAVAIAVVLFTAGYSPALYAAEDSPALSANRTDALTHDAIVQDLSYFRDIWAPKERAFTSSTREQFNVFVADQIAKTRPMTRAQLALVFMQG